MKTNAGKMSVRMGLIAGLAALSIAGLIWTLWSGHATPTSAKSSPSMASRVKVDTGTTRTGGRGQSTAPETARRVTSIDYKESFVQARDYWKYAHEVLPAATAGNTDAQFYLSRALRFCSEQYGVFEENGRLLTLGEGLQIAARLHTSIEAAQEIYNRCHRLREEDATDLGDATDWLVKAAQGGQPVAQVETASLRITQNKLKQFVAAGAFSTPLAVAPPIGGDMAAIPQDLVRKAIQTRDPDVLAEISGMQAVLNPSMSAVDKKVNQVAWLYVACQRGLDCSPNADWIRFSCQPAQNNCAEGSPGVLRAMAGDNWPAVQQRAQELNTKVDAGQWDQLDIGL